MKPLHEIEPGIRILVDALNETGLVETFSSCEGHFNQEEAPYVFNDRERADVRAYLAPRVREADVEELILYVLSDFMDAETKWDAVLTISKQFLAEPREDGNICPLASFFLFDLRPFDRHAPDPDKRRAVDKLIAETAASVRNYTAQRRRSM